MEQRIGANSKPLKGGPLKAEPVTGAGFDPAFVPGLTGPTPTASVSKEPEAEEPEARASEEAGKPAAEDSVVEDSSAGDSSAGDSATEESAAEDSAEPAGEPAEGPVFEASDRRARIVADRKGVRLKLDEEACEFRWEEIAAVETESPRFGKRYTVTVHTPDRRWFPIEIEATARARFKEWDEQLDAVLDAYFEDA
ncbi:hypothetical protein [Streptomyces sp. SID161]|uniref:hypothetical protein n=1 Tax=Streptomyces sp. SID161 TaxID=2690251 RepID=UPI001370985D|nr:hypothetical protein [Streptomyces sp. SID161]